MGLFCHDCWRLRCIIDGAADDPRLGGRRAQHVLAASVTTRCERHGPHDPPASPSSSSSPSNIEIGADGGTSTLAHLVGTQLGQWTAGGAGSKMLMASNAARRLNRLAGASTATLPFPLRRP